MSLATHVRTLGRGPGRSRSLTREEAADAMRLMLGGQAAPEAVGALLMLLRMKGETAAEIAGLAEEAQAGVPAGLNADLDWPSYAAGRSRGAPFFLLAARLVAGAGYRVLLHGRNGTDAAVRGALGAAGIGMVRDAGQAAERLDRDGIAYLPLEDLHPGLSALLDLRGVLGLRSCINTVCRMLNPGRAGASVQGVFHPSYRLLQADAAGALGWRGLSVIKGGGGEFERHPTKAVEVFGLRDGRAFQHVFDALGTGHVRLADGACADTSLAALWSGGVTDPFAEAVVTGTAAVALDTLGHADPGPAARALWDERDRTARAVA